MTSKGLRLASLRRRPTEQRDETHQERKAARAEDQVKQQPDLFALRGGEKSAAQTMAEDAVRNKIFEYKAVSKTKQADPLPRAFCGDMGLAPHRTKKESRYVLPGLDFGDQVLIE